MYRLHLNNSNNARSCGALVPVLSTGTPFPRFSVLGFKQVNERQNGWLLHAVR